MVCNVQRVLFLFSLLFSLSLVFSGVPPAIVRLVQELQGAIEVEEIKRSFASSWLPLPLLLLCFIFAFH